MRSEGSEDVEIASLRSISRGASLFVVGRIVLDAMEILLNVVLTRGLGSSLYGVYAYANTLVSIALVFTNLGSNNAILKFVPQYEDDGRRRRFMLGLAYATSFGAAFFVAAGLFVLAPTISKHTLDDPLLADVLRLFAVLLVFETMIQITTGTFRSLELLEYQVVVAQLGKPLARLVAVVVALSIGLSFYGVMASLVVAGGLVLLLALYLIRTRISLRPSFSPSATPRSDIAEYYDLSIPLVLKDAGAILRSRVDILMVGLFLSSTSVGIYNVTLVLASLLSLPLAAFNQLFPPVASRLYANGNVEELNTVYSIVTRWTFTVSLFLAIGATLYRTELLAVFGEEFTAGAAVLVFFVGSRILGNVTGPSGYLLMVTGHQYVLLVNQWAFGVLNVALNYYFILEYGLVGAALATATVGGLVNVARVLEIWYLEGLFPYTVDFLKPLLAGAGTAATMFATSFALSGVALVAVGGGLGLLGYVAFLSLLGIEQRDREFLAEAVTS